MASSANGKEVEIKSINVPGPDETSSESSFGDTPTNVNKESEEYENASSQDGSDNPDDIRSMNTTDILANDPLYFVLSEVFMTSSAKKNIADLLEELIEVLKSK